MEHCKKKMDFSGENHSRNAKGNKNLYTAIFQYNYNVAISENYREGILFINQLYLKEHNLKALLNKWAKLVAKRIILSREEHKSLMEELEYEFNQLKPIASEVESTEIKNAWMVNLLPGSLNIIKTTNKINAVGFTAARNIRSSYNFYKREYEKLKSITIKTGGINKQGKEYERLMLYWREKLLTTIKNIADNKALYTFLTEYNGDFCIYQFYIEPGEDINNLLKIWGEVLPANKAFSEEKKDYDIIVQKSQDEVHEFLPIEGLVNVWSTYFTLTKGIINIYIVKTDDCLLVEQT